MKTQLLEGYGWQEIGFSHWVLMTPKGNIILHVFMEARNVPHYKQFPPPKYICSYETTARFDSKEDAMLYAETQQLLNPSKNNKKIFS